MDNGETMASSVRQSGEPFVAFVHIPKTAGGTTISMLNNAYGRARVRNVGNYLRGDENTVTKISRAVSRNHDARVLVGHVPIGVFKQHVPDDTLYVTLLREPVDRVLSHYYRHMGSPRREGSDKPPQQSLEEVLELRLPQVSNLQTRFLCDDPDLPPDMPPEALDQAKANLDRLVFVGLQERFNESLVLLERTLGIGTLVPYVRNRHVGGQRPSADDLEPAQRALVVEANAFDIELYEYGRALFEKAVENAGEQFDADVETLRTKSASASVESEGVTAAATEWLQEQLPPGTSRLVSEILDAATAAGVPHDAVRRAQRQLPGVRRNALDEQGRKLWTNRGGSGADPAAHDGSGKGVKAERRRGLKAERRRGHKAERRHGDAATPRADEEVEP
jgi:hypothetical protein